MLIDAEYKRVCNENVLVCTMCLPLELDKRCYLSCPTAQSHGPCVECCEPSRNSVILLAGITPVIVLAPACLHHAAFLKILYGRSQDKPLSTYYVHTEYVLSTYLYVLSSYQYVLSTYLAHTEYRVMPEAFPDFDVAVTSQSCYLVFFRVQTMCILGMAQCCKGTYSGIVQIACTGL
jgi:hypothetical protein